MECSVDGCDRPSFTRTWCRAHYARWYRTGSIMTAIPITPVRPRGMTDVEVFKYYMPGNPPEQGCWDWTSRTNHNGYGVFGYGPKSSEHFAHRTSYLIYHGEIPADKPFILHSCDRPICVHPNHLRAGSRNDNIQDAIDRERVCRGKNRPEARLTEEDVKMIRSSSLTQCELADMLGVRNSTISAVQRGVTWKHLLPSN